MEFQAPVFLLGSHKSGTSLLRSLLDGADGLFIVPVETHFIQFSGFWVDYALRAAQPWTFDFDKAVDNYIQHIQLSNTARVTTSDSVLTGRWDVDGFEAHMRTTGRKRWKEAGYRGLFDAYIEAIHVSLFGGPPQINRFVEKSVENAEYAPFLAQLYPEARFIHIVRNPYATLVALRNYIGRGRYPFLGSALRAMKSGYYYAYKNPLLLSDRYLTIRYEDLVANPEEAMEAIARFVGIEFTDTLLTPTNMGEPWRGNSTTGERFESISLRPLIAWKEDIHSLEMAFINRLFLHVVRDFEYQPVQSDSSVYLPCPGERPRVYLANRYLWRSVARGHGIN